tara:strand:+ start:943 stop:1440 length:498 start_codon:yes stop_codon:yes gene_type:complete
MNDKIPQKHLNQFILNSCFSKKAYTVEEAKEVAFRVYEQTGKVLMPYKCNYCGNIHLSEKSKHRRYTDLNKTINLKKIKPRDTNKYEEKHHCKKSKRLLKPHPKESKSNNNNNNNKQSKVWFQCNKTFYRPTKGMSDHNWQNKKYCNKGCKAKAKAAEDKIWWKK